MNKKKKMLVCGAAVMMLLASVPVLKVQAAAKVPVYVITKVSSKDNSENYRFAYNKNGLMKTRTSGTSASLKSTYTYKDGKIVKEVEKDGKEKSTILYSYTKAGKLAKLTRTDPDGKVTVSRFTYKAGKLVKAKDGGTGSTWVLEYNKKGLTKKMTATSKDGSEVMTVKYTYNTNNDIEKIAFTRKGKGLNLKSLETLSYKYSKKGWKKVAVDYNYYGSAQNYKDTFTYTYAKIDVPESYVNLIKDQQKEISQTGSAFMFVF